MTLPVVERELRVASRYRRTYWERVVWGVLSIIVIAFTINGYLAGPGSQANQGRNIFFTLSAFAFIYAVSAGVLLTADSISEEKREGTLGLLFLTTLRGYDVILGKLAVRSLHGIYGLITIFPIMAVAFLMGGVDWGEMGRMVTLLMNSLFFSLSLGMFISTISRLEMRARMTVFLILATVTLVFPAILGGFYQELSPWIRSALIQLNPVHAWQMGFGPRITQTLRDFWIHQAVIHALGWVLMIAASLIVNRVWRDKGSYSGFSHWSQRLNEWRLGTKLEQAAYRKQLLEINPITWLVNRNRISKWYPMIFLGGCLGLYGVGLLKWGNNMLEEGVVIMYGLTMHTVFKFWVTTEAVRIFSESKKTGALDLIISTPMKISDLVFGYWNGLIYQFRWSVALLLLSDLLLILFSGSDSFEWLMVCLAGIIIFVVDLLTIGWLGMWLSLTRKTMNAILSTLFYILVLPWVTFFMVMIGSGPQSFGFSEVVLTFFAISLFLDFLFYGWSSNSLKNEFRNRVVNQFQAPESKA